MGLGTVLDQQQAVLAHQLEQGIHVARVPAQVHADDRPGPFAEHRGDAVGREVLGIEVDVGEDRPPTGQRNDGGSGEERACRHDHLVTGGQLDGLQRQLQSQGAVGQRDGVPATEPAGELLLEQAVLVPGPVVDRSATQHGHHGVDLVLVHQGPALGWPVGLSIHPEAAFYRPVRRRTPVRAGGRRSLA